MAMRTSSLGRGWRCGDGIGRLAGEGQENLVEAGTAQGQIGQGDAGLVQAADRDREPGRVGEGHGGEAGVAVDRAAGAGQLG
jgi:hypothetical protein